MKNFSTIKGFGKKEKALIGFYQFDGELLKTNIPTKSICYKNYFYGEDGKIEKDFATKEKEWAKVIKHIIESNKYDLDKYQEKTIKQFAIFQYSRTLAIYNYTKGMMYEMLEEHIKNSMPDVDDEKLRELVNKKVENETHISIIIKICDEIVKVINDLDLAIIKFNTTKKLITSDMPIITLNPFCPDKAGFANVGIVILFPVSPEVMVIIYDGKIYKKCNPYMIINNEQEVINLNKYQVISAEERILSKDTDVLQSICSDDELILKRRKYRDKKKIDSSFDGKGTLIEAKSRNIKYDFELSFCKLPQYLRKIPIECREAFQREYSYEARMNLLIRVYKLPELIKQDLHFPATSISKMKAGYSKMQKFMDDYWNIPLKDRAITPELMKVLKSVSAKFFAID